VKGKDANGEGSQHSSACASSVRGRSKLDGTRAETRFGLSAKRTSQYKSAGVSVQSAAGNKNMRHSGLQHVTS